MDRYLIAVDHTPEAAACMHMMEMFMEVGSHYLTNADWGCEDDQHTAWVILDAEDEAHARLAVPPVARKDARIVKLRKYTTEQIREMKTQYERGEEIQT